MSKFILATVTFVLINVLLFLTGPLLIHVFKENAGHRRIIETLVSVKKMPDVLFLGSSIIRLPLWMRDFHSNKDTPAYNQFFEVKSFEDNLKAKFNCDAKVADAALDGAMISDLYFFVQRAINTSHKPRLIFLCLAPRDFADTLTPDETQTVTFNCLFKPHDLIVDKTLFCLDLGQRVKSLCKQIFFLHEHEDRIKTWLKTLLVKANKSVNTDHLKVGVEAVNPLLVKEPKVKSLLEYRLRYGHLEPEQFNRQFIFLEKLVDYCSSLRIPIVVVTMPLTQANKDLLPASYYGLYVNRVQRICSQKNIKLINFANEQFPESDFFDTAHLNDKGAQVLIDKFTSVIASNTGR